MARSKRLLALDLGSSTIEACRVTADGDRLVVNEFAFADVPYETERILCLEDLVERHGLRGSEVVTTMSGRNVIIRYIIMKSMSDTELKDAIQYEIDKHIPFSPDEVYIDTQKLEDMEGQGDDMKVLLVAVRRSALDDHLSILRDVGLRPVAVDVDAFSLGNAFELNFGADFLSQDKPIALIDVGAVKTSINILHQGLSRFTREIYIAGNDLTASISVKLAIETAQAETLKADPGENLPKVRDAVATTVDDLANEIALSFDFFENEYDRSIGYIYLSGGGAMLEGMTDSLSGFFKKPVELWDPTNKVHAKLVGEQATLFRDNATRLAILIGLGCRIWG